MGNNPLVPILEEGQTSRSVARRSTGTASLLIRHPRLSLEPSPLRTLGSRTPCFCARRRCFADAAAGYDTVVQFVNALDDGIEGAPAVMDELVLRLVPGGDIRSLDGGACKGLMFIRERPWVGSYASVRADIPPVQSPS